MTCTQRASHRLVISPWFALRRPGISHADKDMLRGIKYDELYLKENIKFFNAKDIPHFNERTPDGVFNAEYDCCLDTSTAVTEEFLIAWIKEG